MTLRRRPGRSSSCHRLKLSPSKKETRTGEIGDRDGYPRRGLSSRRERAGSVQRNFLDLVRDQTEALAGTGRGFGQTAGSPVMMKSLGMVLIGAAAIAFLV